MVTSLASFAGPLTASSLRWFVPTQQPARRAFGLAVPAEIWSRGTICKRDLVTKPFCVLSEFSMRRDAPRRILLVAPLSGHFPFILREVVAGLVGGADIGVTDWLNARFVAQSEGEFGFDDNIATVIDAMKRLGPELDVIALCQGVVPTLAAAAILAANEPRNAPRSLTLMGGPVDPIANPTRVVELLRQRSMASIEASALDHVIGFTAGAGRLVYPARTQLSALLAYFYRHAMTGGEVFRKLMHDDGIDPARFPFMELFTSLMDLPGRYFMENIERVFVAREPWTGKMRWRGERVDFGALTDTSLMTIEGEVDDIAAPGQTRAAHRLCPNISADRRDHLLVKGAGHFSLFHGRACRDQVLPAIKAFLDRDAGRSCSSEIVPFPSAATA